LWNIAPSSPGLTPWLPYDAEPEVTVAGTDLRLEIPEGRGTTFTIASVIGRYLRTDCSSRIPNRTDLHAGRDIVRLLQYALESIVSEATPPVA
jgi:hypothetical protein